MKFKEYHSGVYYFDAADNTHNDTNHNVNDYCFVETVANNKTMFTRRQVNNADLARKLCGILKRLS